MEGVAASRSRRRPASQPLRSRETPLGSEHRWPSPGKGHPRAGADIECDMLERSAPVPVVTRRRSAPDLGMKTVIVERYATLGGVCLNVGCIPSRRCSTSPP